MKVNLTKPVLGLNGKPLEERGDVIMMNKVIANALMMQEAKENPMQKYELATKLYNAVDEIEITQSEKGFIKQICESGQLIVIIAAQILNIIVDIKE